MKHFYRRTDSIRIFYFKFFLNIGAAAALGRPMAVNRSESLGAIGAVSSGVAARRGDHLRVGFVGLADAAPFLVAKELELFERHGVNVVLSREVGWATIRDKIMFGELDAAHALCPLPVAATLGLNSSATPCVTGLILSRGGNAIVLSREMWQRGVRDGETLATDIGNRRAFRRYILATVFPCSSHAFVLRDWLRSFGIDPDKDVQLVTLPPSQMRRNLAAGTIDGFCAGEPWASLAIDEGIGWSPATSIDIAPNHPEKALMVSERYARERPGEHARLIAALIEACAVCDLPKYRKQIAALISGKRKVDCPAELLDRSLSSEFVYGMGRREAKPGFIRFFAGEANEPGPEAASWVLERMNACGAAVCLEDAVELGERVFRTDLYREGRALAEVAVAYDRASRIFGPVLS